MKKFTLLQSSPLRLSERVLAEIYMVVLYENEVRNLVSHKAGNHGNIFSEPELLRHKLTARNGSRLLSLLRASIPSTQTFYQYRKIFAYS